MTPILTTVAREIVASVFESEGTAIGRAAASGARSGTYDDNAEMKIAISALKRGLSEGLRADQKREAA